jgi:hypothetical protein
VTAPSLHVWDARQLGLTPSSSDFAAVLNATMAGLHADGGGRIFIPPLGTWNAEEPIDNKYERVVLEGVGASHWINGGNDGTLGTVIKKQFNGDDGDYDSLVMLRTPYSSTGSKRRGHGLKNIALDNNLKTGRPLLLDSVAQIRVEDVYSFGAVGYDNTRFLCGVRDVDLDDDTGISDSLIDLYIKQQGSLATGETHCVSMGSSGTSNVNYNRGPGRGIRITALHKNGDVLRAFSADNNEFYIRSFRGAGSGRTIYGGGRRSSPFTDSPLPPRERDYLVQNTGFHDNYIDITGVNSAGAIYLEGTDVTGVIQGVANRARLSGANFQPTPVAGTGSTWLVDKWIP